MTAEQIDMLDNLEYFEKKGYIIDTRWAFTGYKCIIWELHNDHDVDIEIHPINHFGFSTKWEAYKETLKYLNNINI